VTNKTYPMIKSIYGSADDVQMDANDAAAVLPARASRETLWCFVVADRNVDGTLSPVAAGVTPLRCAHLGHPQPDEEA
jgi:hypothetical protein